MMNFIEKLSTFAPLSTHISMRKNFLRKDNDKRLRETWFERGKFLSEGPFFRVSFPVKLSSCSRQYMADSSWMTNVEVHADISAGNQALRFPGLGSVSMDCS